MEAASRALDIPMRIVLNHVNNVAAALNLPLPTRGKFTWRSKRGAAILVLAYLALVRSLRYRREAAMRRKFNFPDRASMARMTNDEAQEIIKYVAGYEMPYMQIMSLEFALFKTYGIESIAKLLIATRNLADPKNSPKRYEDTATIINEFLAWSPTSERATRAIARMNYLHSKYMSSGRITNDDLLYTLSVFITEPQRFAERYDWRSFNEMEACALGVFWKSLGDAMGIDYHGSLPGAEDGWKDGLHFAEEVAAWAKTYEIETMKPNGISPKPAEALLPIMTYWVPFSLKPFVTECLCSLLDDRTREAFKLPESGPTAIALTNGVLSARRLVLKYLMLPRIIEVNRLGKQDPTTGRYLLPQAHGNFPFYTKPTMWNRWGPSALAIWLYGGKVPGDNPGEFMPQGYTFDDIGPVNRMNLGRDEMEKDAQNMMSSGRGGCPF